MSQFKIYHNPKCSKSRETLALLKAEGIEPEVIEYLKDPLTELEILEILKKLDVKPQALVRIKEDVFKENQFSIESPEAIAGILSQYPKVMERPIVVKGERAVLGRPPENIKKLL